MPKQRKKRPKAPYKTRGSSQKAEEATQAAEAPTTQRTPRRQAPNPLRREAQNTVGLLLFCVSAACLAWEKWMKFTQPNCYGHAADDIRYKVPGGIAGQPTQEPYACPDIFSGVLADGFQMPLAYDADGCSVTCPPQSDPVYLLTGKGTRYIFGIPIRKGKPDYHLYVSKKTTLAKNEKKAPKIYSHKPSYESSARDYDGLGNVITCPPKSNHQYTLRDPIAPFMVDTVDYTPCGYVCSPPRGAAVKADIKQQNERGR